MFIEGKRKRKRIEYRIVKIYRYEEYGTHGTYSAAVTQEACGRAALDLILVYNLRIHYTTAGLQ
jgi:hypothetical protein